MSLFLYLFYTQLFKEVEFKTSGTFFLELLDAFPPL